MRLPAKLFMKARPAELPAEWLRISDRSRKGRSGSVRSKEDKMDGNMIGFAAVVLSLGIPMAAMYTFYRVRKLRTDERLAALARGVNVPMEPELTEAARSRRYGILLASGALGFIACCVLMGHADRDAWTAAALGVVPLMIGLGYFADFALIRRDLRTQ